MEQDRGHILNSSAQLWRPGFDRGERIQSEHVGTVGGFYRAAACGWQQKQIIHHMHHHATNKPRRKGKPPPPPPPVDPEDLPAWQILRNDDGENLDFTEAIGTLDLGLYVPVPLPWERGARRRRKSGVAAGRHTAGFVSTVRDLAGRCLREGGAAASSVHSTSPSAEAEYVAATNDLFRKTQSIAMMTAGVSDDKPARPAASSGALPQRPGGAHPRPSPGQQNARDVNRLSALPREPILGSENAAPARTAPRPPPPLPRLRS